MRNSLDFSPFRRATVGFDRLFDLLERDLGGQVAESYPPFDLEQTSEDGYRITLAVAGFGPDEIDVTAQQNLLIISGRKKETVERDYVHRGIAARSFERRFVLGDYVKVRGADLRDGLLSIDLVREVPEEMKARRIEIGTGSDRRRIVDHSDEAANQNEDNQAAA